MLASCDFAPKEKLVLTPTTFAELEGWSNDNHGEAFAAWVKHCDALMKRQPDASTGAGMLEAPASVWQEVCSAAARVEPENPDATRLFFENYFLPFHAANNSKQEGLFTGYYEPEIKGSLKKTGAYTTPVYRLPPDVEKDVPYFTRAEIESGALSNRGLELFWTNDPVGLFFLQIQGSGHVHLSDGRILRIGFAGKNNQPYVSLGKLMGERGLLDKDNINFFTIRQWLRDHPAQGKKLMQENSSYVFFRTLETDGSIGGSNVVLTPLRSLAIDTRYIPYATPLYLQTTLPQTATSSEQPFNRLMIAQDTGGAIKGPVRGDVFFGPGEQAEQLAGMMKNRGRYTLLLPRGLAQKIY